MRNSQTKAARLMSIVVFVALCAGCKTTETSGRGNQETKRLAARERHRHEQRDQSTENLWSAQTNLLNRDGNPMRSP
jgi:hypothetical protein